MSVVRPRETRRQHDATILVGLCCTSRPRRRASRRRQRLARANQAFQLFDVGQKRVPAPPRQVRPRVLSTIHAALAQLRVTSRLELLHVLGQYGVADAQLVAQELKLRSLERSAALRSVAGVSRCRSAASSLLFLRSHRCLVLSALGCAQNEYPRKPVWRHRRKEPRRDHRRISVAFSRRRAERRGESSRRVRLHSWPSCAPSSTMRRSRSSASWGLRRPSRRPTPSSTAQSRPCFAVPSGGGDRARSVDRLHR